MPFKRRGIIYKTVSNQDVMIFNYEISRGELTLTKNKDEKNITDGITFFNGNDLFKRKENIYLLKVFGLSGLLIFFL